MELNAEINKVFGEEIAKLFAAKFQKKKFNRYSFIYSRIRQKHPNWSHGKIKYCTIYALRRNK